MYADQTSYMINTNASLKDLNTRLEADGIKVKSLLNNSFGCCLARWDPKLSSGDCSQRNPGLWRRSLVGDPDWRRRVCLLPSVCQVGCFGGAVSLWLFDENLIWNLFQMRFDYCQSRWGYIEQRDATVEKIERVSYFWVWLVILRNLLCFFGDVGWACIFTGF